MRKVASGLRRWRQVPKSSQPSRIRPWKKDERGLPIPHVNVLVRDTHVCRLQDHYNTSLRDDLMYMTYVHESKARPPPRQIRLTYDPEDPYSKYRNNPVVGGSQIGKKPAPISTCENVVKLEKICLHTMEKNALSNRSNLLGLLMAFRALSGETKHGGGWKSSNGVELVRGRKNVSGWVRPGLPIGAKVELKGEKMYEFLGSLVQFVLPRLREFDGIILPPASANLQTPAGVSGVVSMGLPPEAMSFFPQIEVNPDAYPRMYGMHIHFVTNAEGAGAQNKARALLSGFQLPFTRR
ncbi:mitochondrial 50S ribosomal protein L5 [Phellopilus nigrolimitatus]|nr:mitochondrial 50S ribosomal protein L5 [Phellopilus nigrolimitatus]